MYRVIIFPNHVLHIINQQGWDFELQRVKISPDKDVIMQKTLFAVYILRAVVRNEDGGSARNQHIQNLLDGLEDAVNHFARDIADYRRTQLKIFESLPKNELEQLKRKILTQLSLLQK